MNTFTAQILILLTTIVAVQPIIVVMQDALSGINKCERSAPPESNDCSECIYSVDEGESSEYISEAVLSRTLMRHHDESLARLFHSSDLDCTQDFIGTVTPPPKF